MKRFQLIILLFICLSIETTGQNNGWNTFTNGNQIRAIANDKSFIWVGTKSGGLVKINKATNTPTFYTQLNSSIPDRTVTSIEIGINGVVWVGTNNGLAQFNGSDWYTYDTANSGLPKNMVTSVASDKLGNIWIGTLGGGLAKLNGSDWEVYNTSNSGINTNSIRIVETDSSDNIWLAAGYYVNEPKNLVRFDRENWTIFNSSNSPLYFPVSALTVDTNNRIWVASSDLYCYDGVTWTSISNNFQSAINSISIHDNGIWVGTSQNGLAYHDGTNWTKYNQYNSDLPDDHITVLNRDEKDNCWVGLLNNGFGTFDGLWTDYNTSNSGFLGTSYVTSIKIDESGDSWITSEHDMILTQFNGSNWHHFNIPFNLTPYDMPYVKALGIDNDGSKWVGTGKGLANLDDTIWTTYTTSNSGLEGYGIILSITIDEDNIKWIGTAYGGITKLEGQTWKTFKTTNSELPDNGVYLIHADKNNNVWIGAKRYVGTGLTKFNGINDWITYDISNSDLPDNLVTSIDSDESGLLWIGTPMGLSTFNGNNNWFTYDTSNSGLPENYITSIAIGDSSTKWIGTMSSGLVKYYGSTWTIYNTSNSGLPSNKINLITIDSHNVIWLSTGYGGVTVFNPDYNSNIISEIGSSDNIAIIYPNPTTNQLNIEFTSEVDVLRIELYNSTGYFLRKYIVTSDRVTVPLDFFPSGLYILKVYHKQGVMSKKFIIK